MTYIHNLPASVFWQVVCRCDIWIIRVSVVVESQIPKERVFLITHRFRHEREDIGQFAFEVRDEIIHRHFALHNLDCVHLGFERLPNRLALFGIVKTAPEKRGDVDDSLVVFLVLVARRKRETRRTNEAYRKARRNRSFCSHIFPFL